MRYDRWDVILFPGNTSVPIQEFKTACYSSRDPNDPTPVLTSYISSLPPTAPFRISIYSWAASTKPSAEIESLREERQSITYMLHVIVDGVRVYHGLLDTSSKWPKEIAYEHPNLLASEPPTNSRKACLRFPDFAADSILRPTMNIYEQNSRINITLSEQLVDHKNRQELGAKIDIVRFSFIHAPQAILEQSGISWPIRNPLYHPGNLQQHMMRQVFDKQVVPQHELRGTHKIPVRNLSRVSTARHSGLQLPDPIPRPHSQPPSLSMFPRPTQPTKQDRAAQKEDDKLSESRIADSSLQHVRLINEQPGYLVSSAPLDNTVVALVNQPLIAQPSALQINKDQHRRNALLSSDDPFAIMADVTDPFIEEHHLDRGPTSRSSTSINQPFFGHKHNLSLASFPWNDNNLSGRKDFLQGLSSMASLSRGNNTSVRPLTSHIGRIDTARMATFGGASHKENRPPSQARMPSSFPGANRVPTPNPFVAAHPHLDPELLSKDFSTKDNSRGNTGYQRIGDYRTLDKTKHTLRSMSRATTDLSALSTRPNALSQLRNANSTLEIIDVDALSPDKTYKPANTALPTIPTAKLSPFKLSHKPATSSMDSTRRLENALFHALTDGDGQPGADFDISLGMTGQQVLDAVEEPEVEVHDGSDVDDIASCEGQGAGVKRKVSDSSVDEEPGDDVNKREKSEGGSGGGNVDESGLVGVAEP